MFGRNFKNIQENIKLRNWSEAAKNIAIESLSVVVLLGLFFISISHKLHKDSNSTPIKKDIVSEAPVEEELDITYPDNEDWPVYRNSWYGFIAKYPGDW